MKPKTREEIEVFTKEYQSTPHLELQKKYNVKYDTLRHWASDFGVKKIAENTEDTPEVIYKPYPDFGIRAFPKIIKKRDVEEIGIILADHHVGKRTENYSTDIYQTRMEALLKKVMRIIELHRPIRKANIFMLGDMVQGENVYQGSKIEETEYSVWKQINSHAIPTLSRFFLSLSQGVEEVEGWGVWGNHGKYSREGTTRTNWDNFVYAGLASALANQKRIKINCPTEFYQLVTILGWRFFLFHGDQVRASQGIPLFALRRKLQEWYAYMKGFDYAYCGHFHTWGADQVNSRADYQISPPLVTGDSWALEVVGRASKPVQLVFGIHPKEGRTFEYKLLCDPNFTTF